MVCPVFHEQTVENEVEIIQCEHEKNKYSDLWRTNQVRTVNDNMYQTVDRWSEPQPTHATPSVTSLPEQGKPYR